MLPALAFASGWMADRLKGMLSIALSSVPSAQPQQWMTGLAMQFFLLALCLVLPLTAVSVLGGIVGMGMQVGLRISFKALTPTFNSLNPANGIKKGGAWKSLLEGLQLRTSVIAVLVAYELRPPA